MKYKPKLLFSSVLLATVAGCATQTPTPTVNYPPPSAPTATAPTAAPPRAPTSATPTAPPAPPVVPAPVEASPSAADIAAAEAGLSAGIVQFERGNFRNAISQLTPLAASNSALDNNQRVRALKFLAFSHCSASGAQARASCRDAFERAFRLNPSFDLAPAERGHPDWQGAFEQARRSVTGR